MRRLRIYILTRTALYRTVWLLGATSIAGAAVLGLDGSWELAIGLALLGVLLFWLSGQWVFSVGHDALARYYGRVRSAWVDWASASEAKAKEGTDRHGERSRMMRATEDFTGKLERIHPPAQVAGQHQALVDALHRYHAALGDYAPSDRGAGGQRAASDAVTATASDLERTLEALHDRLRQLEAWDVPLKAPTPR